MVGQHHWAAASTMRAPLFSSGLLALQITPGLCRGPGLHSTLLLPPPQPWATSYLPCKGPEPPSLQSQGLRLLLCQLRILLQVEKLRSEESKKPTKLDWASWRTQELKAKTQAGPGWCGRQNNGPLRGVHILISEPVNRLPFMAKGSWRCWCN